ncbi:MAG TPA: hypothetical protein VFT74_12955, partial [Isosphaeraceae bacterium]|nr:hypothetical protein [Isosphaeraceae bacterium]
MIRRLLDLILIVLILVGGYRSWQSSQERDRLRDTHKRLARITGVLPITDPSRVHVVALETGDPMHFAWRFYVPEKYNMRVADNQGSSSSWSSNAAEFIGRVRFREDDQGRLEIHEHMKFSSGRSNLGSKELTRLLHGRWDQLRVEQFGAPEMAVLDADESAVLLRLSLPDDLAA